MSPMTCKDDPLSIAPSVRSSEAMTTVAPTETAFPKVVAPCTSQSAPRKVFPSNDNAEPQNMPPLIEECRAEEIEHKAEAEEHGAREAVGYPLLTGAIKTGARLAIWLSSRV